MADCWRDHRWELSIHTLLWGAFVLLIGSGESNGIGWFHQPEHSLWIPLIIGTACNAGIFLLAGGAAVSLINTGRWWPTLRALVIALAIGLVLKSLLQWAYVQLVVVDLQQLGLRDFAAENSYSLVVMLALGAVYFLARQAIMPTPAEPVILVKSGQASHRLRLKDIRYLKAEANYIAYHHGERSLLVLQTMDAALDQLNDPRFVRVHRSYIVNMERVSAIDSAALFLGEQRIPVGKTYRSAVREVLATSWHGSASEVREPPGSKAN